MRPVNLSAALLGWRTGVTTWEWQTKQNKWGLLLGALDLCFLQLQHCLTGQAQRQLREHFYCFKAGITYGCIPKPLQSASHNWFTDSFSFTVESSPKKVKVLFSKKQFLFLKAHLKWLKLRFRAFLLDNGSRRTIARKQFTYPGLSHKAQFKEDIVQIPCCHPFIVWQGRPSECIILYVTARYAIFSPKPCINF